MEQRADENTSQLVAAKPTVPASADINDEIAELVAPDEDSRILDLGCGWGETIDRLLPLLGPNGYIMGVDRHVRALRSVQRRYLEEIAAGKLELLDQDISYGLGNANVSMDRIVCHNSLEWIAGPGKLLDSFYRIVRPGGRVVVCHVDYCSVEYASSYPETTKALVDNFYDQRRSWLHHIDPTLGSRIEELFDKSQFGGATTHLHIDADTSFKRAAYSSTFAEALIFASAGLSWIKEEKVALWKDDLIERSKNGTFSFKLTSYIVVADKEE